MIGFEIILYSMIGLIGSISAGSIFLRVKLKRQFLEEMESSEDKNYLYDPFGSDYPRHTLLSRNKSSQFPDDPVFRGIMDFLYPISMSYKHVRKSKEAIQIEKRLNMVSIVMLVSCFMLFAIVAFGLF